MSDFISKKQRSMELVLEAKDHLKEAHELLYDVEAGWAEDRIMEELERASRTVSHIIFRMNKAGYED